MSSENEIYLSDIMDLGNINEYKLHLACTSSDGLHPLDEYVANRENWLDWNRWKGNKNDWTRKYILSFMEYYPKANCYLFGGVFEVKERLNDRYEISDVSEFAKWEARLICKFYRYQGLRGRAFHLKGLLERFTVDSILSTKYTGERFCGYENINHYFSSLKSIVYSEKNDWKSALEVVKGVYLIFDTLNGKVYIGSAYGRQGIWARLVSYICTGNGGNDELTNVISKAGKEYAMRNFKFSILEIFSFNTPDAVIIQRESHWKKVMLSRQFGYNKN